MIIGIICLSRVVGALAHWRETLSKQLNAMPNKRLTHSSSTDQAMAPASDLLGTQVRPWRRQRVHVLERSPRQESHDDRDSDRSRQGKAEKIHQGNGKSAVGKGCRGVDQSVAVAWFIYLYLQTFINTKGIHSRQSLAITYVTAYYSTA